RNQDVPVGRRRQHLHGAAAQGRLQAGLHDRVPAEDRPAAAGDRRQMSDDALIRIEHVDMVYQAESGPVEALRDISMTIGRGEFLALVGPSGCGKSTLLRCIAGLRPVTGGRIIVDGTPVTEPIPKVGMVFQAPIMLKWRTVLANVLLPAELSGLTPPHFPPRAR